MSNQSIRQILNIAKNTRLIRNVGLSAQVDHGKTTFSDVLLGYAGIISEKLAGRVLYLDYLEEEQKRGITMKTSAISMVLKYNKDNFVLNLIDTPGHVDFSGKVARAMRLMDGVIILVDAVEGIMAQTESYLNIALKEYVRPLLFINKVDRLIDEISLTPSAIYHRFEEIIVEFNELIESFGDDYQRKKWQVDPNEDTVFFGSALHKWGFTLKSALAKNMKFNDIIKLHKKSKERLSEILPLAETAIRVIYKKIPDPLTACKYRIKALWQGQLDPKISGCDDSDITLFYVNKVIFEGGRILAVGRIFSGVLKAGEYFVLNSNERVKVHNVRLLLGSLTKHVDEIPKGMVFGAVMQAKPGFSYSNRPLNGTFKPPHYSAVPVIFVAIEPKNFSQFDKLLEIIKKIQLSDPNFTMQIDKNTGQIWLGGLGELHLEILLKEISKRVPIYHTEPIISYKEILTNSYIYENDSLVFDISPATEKGFTLKDLLVGYVKNSYDGNLIILKNFTTDERDTMLSLLTNILKNGPLVGEPVTGAYILLKKKDRDKKIDFNEVMNILAEAFTKVKTEIAEPYYLFTITTYADYIGAITSEINRREGDIKSVESTSGRMVKIVGIIPVRTSLKLPSEIRAISHGRASIQLEFYDYLIAKDKAKERIIHEIRIRKGLT